MRLLITPLDYSGKAGVSHTGLRVSCLNTAKVLVNAGLDVLVVPIVSAFANPKIPGQNLDELIQQYSPTHVVTAAFWEPIPDVSALSLKYPYVQFDVNCHSNIAFLQVEPKGISILRQLVDLEMSSTNFHVSGNSHNFVQAVTGSWRSPCAYLPNLYYLDGTTPTSQPLYAGGTLRIGCFGAPRPMKNLTVAAWAALGIAAARNAQLEFFINTGRDDMKGVGLTIVNAVKSIVNDLPYATLVLQPWQGWPAHRRLTSSMNLVIQPSLSETFLIVAADAVADGVPVVGSNVVEWLPDYWKANPDDVEDVVRVGLALLADHRAPQQGLAALAANNVSGVAAWKSYLGVS